jgi:hypothetical protein
MGLFLAVGGSNAKPDATRAPTDPARVEPRCSAIRWNDELLRALPRLADGCREVVSAGGKRWARLETNFVGAAETGTFTTEVLDTQDRLIGQVTLRPTASQRITLGGSAYQFSELGRYQKLSLFVPEGEREIFSQLDAPPDQHARLILTDLNAGAADAETPAAALPAPPADATLPLVHRTGTSVALLVLSGAGLLAVLSGAALALRRRTAGARPAPGIAARQFEAK